MSLGDLLNNTGEDGLNVGEKRLVHGQGACGRDIGLDGIKPERREPLHC